MKALEGLKILDFTTLLPGPYATLVLADLGAEVLKVSSPSKQDIVLEYEPFVEGTDIAANEAWLGRNKRNIFLNLKHPKAIAIVKQLIQEYDIVIEQFRPGVMEKLGLGYEALKAVNPALIYCSLTGYGQTGPMAKAAGHDCNYLARSGNLAMAGYRDAGPAPMNIQIADICVGSMNSVVGILAAVQYRNRTGKGQYIDVAMLDGLVQRIEEELGESVTLVTPGGAARLVEPLLRHAHTHDPEMLTLGLAYLYDRNRAQCPLANEEAE